MTRVCFTSAHWPACFPHVISPYPDEWLAGLLLRCDEINHYASGTTFRTLLHVTSHPVLLTASPLIVVPETLLEDLARHLLVSKEDLLATTYGRELSRLYLPAHAASNQRRRGQTLSSFLGKRVGSHGERFHICPLCIAQARLLRRPLVLPHLTSCPIHQVTLQSRCVCGTPISPFFRGTRPFACSLCDLDWARLPLIPLAPSGGTRERDLWALYAFFLSNGTYELKHSALSLLRSSLQAHPSLFFTLVDGRIFFGPTERLDRLPLGDIVNLLVTLGISPDALVRPALTSPEVCV